MWIKFIPKHLKMQMPSTRAWKLPVTTIDVHLQMLISPKLSPLLDTGSSHSTSPQMDHVENHHLVLEPIKTPNDSNWQVQVILVPEFGAPDVCRLKLSRKSMEVSVPRLGRRMFSLQMVWNPTQKMVIPTVRRFGTVHVLGK